jgi:aminobenzoyl-glutamate transport protein
MSDSDEQSGSGRSFSGWIERVGHKIPDPVIIFMAFYPIAFLATVFMGGHTFETMGAGGEPVSYTILPMYQAEHVRWIFDNALLRNWLAFGNGVLGVILVVMLAIGVAEHSGLFAALIKRVATHIPQAWLPLLLMFVGITSSVATDAGYLVLIPLAGLLYAGLGRNPLIGMAAAFAGVSAGFSANLIPGTPIDVIIGMNAQVFAEAQGVPFTTAEGTPLRPATMHYWFSAASTLLLALAGAWVTRRFVEPKLDRQPFELPEALRLDEYEVTAAERKGLKAAGWGVLVAALVIGGLSLGPLGIYTDAAGNRILPFMNNIVLLISLFFIIVGVPFGYASGSFRRVADVVQAMVKQMNTMGYILVLTFFSYNFLGLLSYSGLGSYVTYLGAEGLVALGLQRFPVLLLIGFVFTTAIINLLIAGLTSKWMLLGPIFVPMLYFVNPAMTPDLVAAAFRVADSATNIITPMLVYCGVILAFMRKYRPGLGFGDMLLIMLPYSITFMIVWTALLVAFFVFGIPLGF